MSENARRPMEGWYLRDCLKKLANISAIAYSLKMDLEPLSEEDIAAGAEPLTPEQIQTELEEISRLATSLALDEMKATPEEWYEANDKIA